MYTGTCQSSLQGNTVCHVPAVGMNAMEISLGRICKLCAEEESDLLTLNLVKMKVLFPQLPYEEDRLPYHACRKCSDKLDDFFKFHEIVLASDARIRSLVDALNKVQTRRDVKSTSAERPLGQAVSSENDETVQAGKITSTEIECPHCEKSVDSKSALRSHVRLEHPYQTRRRYGCRVCSLDFSTAEERSLHMVVHTGEKPFLCDQCGKSFEHAANLRAHLTTHSTIRNRFPCDVCHKHFLKRKFLKDHQNIHTGEKPYSCEKCGKAFAGKGLLRQHQWTHKSNSFGCGYCGKAFSRKGNMATHVKEIHLKTDIRPAMKCSEVRQDSPDDPKFAMVAETENEVNATNPVISEKGAAESTAYDCKRCKKSFRDHLSLKEHRAIHVDITDCNICGKTFKHHGSLTYHRRVAHTGERPFKCDHCDLRFPLRSVLTTHERRTHTGYTPHVCSHCANAFHSGGALRAHMLTHMDVKPFMCELCGKGFCRKSSLTTHLKAHLGDRPHKCAVCGISFLQKVNLLRHQKQHAPSSRPFFCKFCGESFSKRSDAAKHALCRKKLMVPTKVTDFQSAEKILDLVAQTHFTTD